MTAIPSVITLRKSANRIQTAVALAIAILFPHHGVGASPPPVDLGAASGFAVLAGSAITNTGPTTITGDVGTFPTPAITGFGTVTLNGINQGGDAATQAAKTDLTAAFNDAAARIPTTIYAPIFDLGGKTLSPGVYNDPSSFGITGNLTLDGGGNPNAVWIFQAGSTLITASDSTLTLIGGAQASNVFWEVGSSATLGTGTVFSGDILALTSITLTTGATVDGAAMAVNGAVTMDSNTITAATSPVPEPGSALLVGCGLVLLLTFRRRRTSGPDSPRKALQSVWAPACHEKQVL